MYSGANRAKLQIELRLKNVLDEELDRPSKQQLHGISTGKLLVHGFMVQTGGGPGAQDKAKGKTARYTVKGFIRHALLELCTASKVAEYTLIRFRDPAAAACSCQHRGAAALFRSAVLHAALQEKAAAALQRDDPEERAEGCIKGR